MFWIERIMERKQAEIFFGRSHNLDGECLDTENAKYNWQGRSKIYFGLLGKDFCLNDCLNLADNLNPKNLEKLIDQPGNWPVGFVLTFAPGEVASQLYGLLGDDALFNAHRAAYQATLSHLEREITVPLIVDRVETGRRKTRNLLYAAIDHLRCVPWPVDKGPEIKYKKYYDLYSQCYVPNLTWVSEIEKFHPLVDKNAYPLWFHAERYYREAFAEELKEGDYIVCGSDQLAGITASAIERILNPAQNGLEALFEHSKVVPAVLDDLAQAN